MQAVLEADIGHLKPCLDDIGDEDELARVRLVEPEVDGGEIAGGHRVERHLGAVGRDP